MEFYWIYSVCTILCIYLGHSSEHPAASPAVDSSPDQNMFHYQIEDNKLNGSVQALSSSPLKELLKLELLISLLRQIPTISKDQELAHEEKQEPIIEISKIDANDTSDSEWAFTFPQTYRHEDLREWRPAIIVPKENNHPGEMGKAVKISPQQQAITKEILRFKENQFDIVVSDMISLNRSLPDVRHPECKSKIYPSKLPTASIVIVFHNEAWSTLLRTVWSVINRSPRSLLKEIILVDDASESENLGEELDNYVKKLPVPTIVLRTVTRTGLIRAKLLGAKHVTGQVIAFLDAHCECTEGWLEPLLARIAVDRTTVVCPIIDVISDKTFEYVPSSEKIWGGFNWNLNFRWYRLPWREVERRGNDKTAPIRSPTMSGLMAIDKDFFYEIGSYDEGLDIWGGDNLELSFKIWQCGGTLEIIPCSHVGHVFRDKSPYSFPGGVAKTILHNNARVAEVWMDEWKDFYYAVNPGVQQANAGDVTERKALRERLKCKSFRWYLENIYPETQLPFDYYFLGEIRNAESGICLDVMGSKYGGRIGSNYCRGLGGDQVFAYTKQRQIISNDNCLDAANSRGPVNLVRCKGMKGNQEWNYDKDDKTIKHVNSGNCLTRGTKEDPNTPSLMPCDNSEGQQWLMQSQFKWQVGPQSSNSTFKF